ncbi:hypothetical protein AMS68_002635 [Peltaster fructicola]|uniref:Phosphatidate phosphatase APP1 catalytic domain-containing protein n=1 Tax=Peltaster fructicola TaxID=286661 RepID=A0A6H0XR53_9PEZI|nr:hypothetical protein AMS68_002635 [Peltaster fructicola]
MAYTGPASLEAREPGSRRKKLAEYWKAANDFRQNYLQGGDADFYGKGRHGQDYDGAFPDAAVVRSGNEEMILFPSYGRKHTKETMDNVSSTGNDAEYWQREWTRHEDNKALVDVDVRGWIYTPQRGPVTRRQRLMIGLARQLSGLAAPPSDVFQDDQMPNRMTNSDQTSKQEEDLIQLEAEHIMQRGRIEAEFAGRGAFSEQPGRTGVDERRFSSHSRSHSTDLQHSSRIGSYSSDDSGHITPIQKRDSWAQPGKMSAAELSIANKHLLHRLRPFMATPLVESPVKAFFYNDTTAREKTVFTNPSGHFACRATLDFVPTHVRILAGSDLEATEEVTITSATGVSLISDIDDTIKHSAISSGPREIFRNAFIRDLGDLTIEGVKDWYQKLSSLGVTFHYVSNSPWQIYPILTSFFKTAGLPGGSFHLKAYSGMLQGIFEPVAERKRSSLDKLMRDFPHRKFILVGDSGEADLEVYTEVVLDNPGRILAVFIRDVTSPPDKSGYFDPPYGSPGRSRNSSRSNGSDGFSFTKRSTRPNDAYDEDAALQAAITASLADDPRPPLPSRMPSSPLARAQMSASPEEDLIDLSGDLSTPGSWVSANPWGAKVTMHRASQVKAGVQSTPSPPTPRKPDALRSASPNIPSSKQPPPVPKKPSSAVTSASAASHTVQTLNTLRQEDKKKPPPLPVRRTYRDMAREKMSSVLPSPTADRDGVPIRQRPAPLRALTSSRIDMPRPLTAISPKLGGQRHPDPSSIPDRPLTSGRRVGSSSSISSMRKTAQRMSSGYSDDGMPSSPGEAGMTKKEFLWAQRLTKAKSILERQGVTLHTWRVGSDAQNVCVKLVEKALKEFEKHDKL